MPVAPLEPILTDADHQAALKEVERLWGAPIGTEDGDRFDRLVDLIEAYEEEHYPIGSIRSSTSTT